MSLVAPLERLLLTLWAGALWSIGYLAVPILFATLDERMLAGRLAGEMFGWVSMIGLVCGALLVVLAYERRGRQLLLLVMVVLVAVGEFLLQPQMAALKAEGLLEGSEAASRFAMLHGVSSLLYLFVSLAALWLVWRGREWGSRRAAA